MEIIEITKNCNSAAAHIRYFSCCARQIVGYMWIWQGCRYSDHVFVQSRRFLLLYSLPAYTTSKSQVALKKYVSTLTENVDKKPMKAIILWNKDEDAKNTGKWWICISSWLCVAEDESSTRSINQNTDSLKTSAKLKWFICEDNQSCEEANDHKTCLVRMEAENQSSLPLSSGIIW